MFGRLLIANRGEIALRIVRACRVLGIEPVVAHSEADRGAPWVRAAGRGVCVGPAPAGASYLDADAMLQAALQCECHALHPGYGFLSENAVFAARCLQAGIAWVGPGPEAIRRMGDKVEARRTAAAAGLATVPGSDGVLGSAAEAAAVAERVGYPVLLKAAGGGGGRGMRRCDGPAMLARAYAEASLEAEKAFGTPALYLESLVLGGRHVEFQVLGDAFGTIVHLGERECSVQRHHQKLLEESPSPVVDAEARERVGAGVVAALRAVGYRSAGTVEFLRAADGRLLFLEVNARLQVEHPVTEAVTGIDIVVEQIRIAASERLRLRQEDVRHEGHAIELRINAEDPEAGFRPDPGTITSFSAPPERIGGAAVRWDSAAEPGMRIPPHYDSLLGKLIVHAGDRPAAIEGARRALAAMRIEGVRTTIPFHLRVLDDPGFVRGDYDLGLVGRLVGAPSPAAG